MGYDRDARQPAHLTPNFDRMARFAPRPPCVHLPAGAVRRALVCRLTIPTTVGCYRNGIPCRRERARWPTTSVRRATTLATSVNGIWAARGGAGERGGYDYWLAANALEFTRMPTAARGRRVPTGAPPGYRVDASPMPPSATSTRTSANRSSLPPSSNRTSRTGSTLSRPEGMRNAIARADPAGFTALGGTTHQHLAGYYGMVKRLDEALGRMLDAFRASACAKRHRALHLTTAATSRRATAVSARATTVPSACRRRCGPGFTGGGSIRQLVSLLTCRRRCSLPPGCPPEEMQGRSLLPLRAAPTPSGPKRCSCDQRGAGGPRPPHAPLEVLRQRPDKHPIRLLSDRYVEASMTRGRPYELVNLIGFESHRG